MNPRDDFPEMVERIKPLSTFVIFLACLIVFILYTAYWIDEKVIALKKKCLASK